MSERFKKLLVRAMASACILTFVWKLWGFAACAVLYMAVRWAYLCGED